MRGLADALFLRDPNRVKHWRKVWMSGGSLYGKPLPPFVVDHEPEFMPLEEQKELFAQRVKKLGLFQFLLRPALSEGSIGSAVLPLNIHNIDRDPITGQAAFPDQQVLARIRSLLAARSGKPLAALLAEQDVTPGSLGRSTTSLVKLLLPNQNNPGADNRSGTGNG